MPKVYTIEEARAALVELLPTINDLIEVRADTVELTAAIQFGTPSPLGGMAELKAAEARLEELLTRLRTSDLQVKGVAPVLLDFPSELDGKPVLLCWLEGDTDLCWYHRPDLGFAGRRRLPDRPAADGDQ